MPIRSAPRASYSPRIASTTSSAISSNGRRSPASRCSSARRRSAEHDQPDHRHRAGVGCNALCDLLHQEVPHVHALAGLRQPHAACDQRRADRVQQLPHYRRPPRSPQMNSSILPPLADLTIFAPAATAPPKLLKALAVIARDLHPRLQIEGFATHGQCILCALTVRDFLQDIGFHDAKAASVAFTVQAERNGQPLHSLGIRVPGTKPQSDKWNGHLVTVLPKTGWLIDPTLYNAVRPQWPVLTGMAAIPLFKPVALNKQMRALAGFTCREGDVTTTAGWYTRTNNGQWTNAPDTIGHRRTATVASMVSAFGP